MKDLLEEIAKLREQLDHVNHLLACESIKAERAENRAEAAEAKLKELSEQEPIGEMNITGVLWFGKNPHAFPVGTKYYTAPIPPADVKELQAKLDAAIDALAERDDKETRQEKRIAERERKLAEQQARILALLEDLGRENNEFYKDSPERGTEELNTLLAKSREEGRKEAVPEIANLREVDLRGDFAVQLVFSSCRAASAFADAMLASAQKPEVKI